MNQKRLLQIGKWIIMGILTAGNFMFYIINDDKVNLLMAFLIFVFSVYEFFTALSGKKINLAFKMYLFTFYLLAVLSLFLCVRGFLTDNFKSAVISLILVAGDTALILYSVHRATHRE
jgi:hypothetical protein